MSFIMKKPLLMIPGPMDVPDEVLRRCGHQVFPHYDVGTDFPAFYHQLTEKAKVVFGLREGYASERRGRPHTHLGGPFPSRGGCGD